MVRAGPFPHVSWSCDLAYLNAGSQTLPEAEMGTIVEYQYWALIYYSFSVPYLKSAALNVDVRDIEFYAPRNWLNAKYLTMDINVSLE